MKPEPNISVFKAQKCTAGLQLRCQVPPPTGHIWYCIISDHCLHTHNIDLSSLHHKHIFLCHSCKIGCHFVSTAPSAAAPRHLAAPSSRVWKAACADDAAISKQALLFRLEAATFCIFKAFCLFLSGPFHMSGMQWVSLGIERVLKAALSRNSSTTYLSVTQD